MKILQIITDLDTGGAEMMLLKILESLTKHPEKFTGEILVISLMRGGAIAERIESLGLNVFSLNLIQGQKPEFKHIVKFYRVVKSFSPDVIQGWMYHGNLAATVATLFLYFSMKKTKLFWNIRQTLYALENEKRLTQTIIKFSALISWIPKKVIYNSYRSMSQHESIGFLANKSSMIPNGFDLSEFLPEKKSRKKLRSFLGVNEDRFLIGHVARYHPMKDHLNLLKAAKIVLKVYNEVHFVLIGNNVTSENGHLAEFIDNINPKKNIHLLGCRPDVFKIMSGLDILVSSSAWGEGFPNVVGEALACGVPCVVTDVGDSALIVGDCGYVCRAEDSQALAYDMLKMIKNNDERTDMGLRARERIRKKYLIEKISDQYLDLYLQ